MVGVTCIFECKINSGKLQYYASECGFTKEIMNAKIDV